MVVDVQNQDSQYRCILLQNKLTEHTSTKPIHGMRRAVLSVSAPNWTPYMAYKCCNNIIPHGIPMLYQYNTSIGTSTKIADLVQNYDGHFRVKNFTYLNLKDTINKHTFQTNKQKKKKSKHGRKPKSPFKS